MRDKYYSEHILLDILVHISRWAVGLIFIAAAVPKILDAESFMRIVANYNLVPLFLVPFAALIIPWLEFACAVCLIANRSIQGASALLSVLIITFIGGLTVNYLRGADFDCGCFGILFHSGSVSMLTIARDAFLLGLTAFILILSRGRKMPLFRSEEEKAGI